MTTKHFSFIEPIPEKSTERRKNYLWLKCVCLWGKSEPVLVVWARSCQCVLVQSRNMKQLTNRIPKVHSQQYLRYSILLWPTSPFSLRILRLNSFPSRQMKSSPGCRMPHLVAMARAVLMLSPVTIRTVMPARWHFLIASGTWSKSGHTREEECMLFLQITRDIFN